MTDEETVSVNSTSSAAEPPAISSTSIALTSSSTSTLLSTSSSSSASSSSSSTSSSTVASSGSTAIPGSATWLEVVKDMRSLRDSLGPRPSKEDVTAALKAMIVVDRWLINELDVCLHQPAPEGLDINIFRHLQVLREERIRAEAELKKRPHAIIVAQEERFQHYDAIIMHTEKVLLPGFFIAGASPASSLQVPTFTIPASSAAAVAMAKLQSWAAQDGHPSSAPVYRSRNGISADTNFFHVTSPSPLESPVRSRSMEASPSRGKAMMPASSTVGFVPTSAARHAIATSGGLGAALVGSPSHQAAADRLSSIAEDKTGIQVHPALREMIEDALADGRESFNIGGRWGGCIEYVPETLGELEALTSLNLSNQNLVLLPDAIGHLINLTDIFIECNKIFELPSSIGQLTNLTRLSGNHNYLEELPVSIGKCIALKELSVEFNSLRAMPEAVGKLTNLRVLHAHLNQIRRLPRTIGGLVSLTELDVHFNSLEGIPDGLTSLTNLTRLNISGNHFGLKQLPSGIGYLEKLTELDISENHLKELPESFALLTNLQRLKLDGNPLRCPPLKVADQGLTAVMAYMQKKYRDEGSAGAAMRKKSGLSRLWATIGGSGPMQERDDLFPDG